MRRVLVDTDIYIEAILGNKNVAAQLRKIDLIGMSTVSAGELLVGLKGGKNRQEQMARFETFLDSPRVKLYSISYATAEFYSEIFIKLRRAGTPIPTNDIWIAATALEQGLLVLTLDKHFRKVPGLSFYE
ncbi:MAG: type II toxin-antitoxin system VapC family toxin [bacterium]